MHDFEMEMFRRHPAWKVVLEQYWEHQRLCRQYDPHHDGWVSRLSSIPGLTAEELPQAHGWLIALGFLKFDFPNRERGLMYQVSPLGKQVLDHAQHESGEDANTSTASTEA
ncbi:MAG: hypothetical protein KatS3mg114_0693 [Planctomycetaceae bacterium]|nr:MAG: hypothetical protein KatS3mg114_0693 [Planctomycetaceae bacterium]